MAKEIVLTYTRETVYTMEVAGRDLTKLAAAIGISRDGLLKLIEDADLDQHSDEIYIFISDNERLIKETEEGDADSLEIEYINE